MSDWKRCTLSDLGEIVGGATPSTINESYYGGDIAWITPKDLSTFQGRFISRGERNITAEGLKNSSARLMPPYSVLFTSRAPIGYVAITENEVCTNQGFKSIVPNTITDYLFLYYLLVHNRKRIENMGSGTTFKEVSGSVMKQIEVSVPSDKTEQSAIAEILGALDNKIENNLKINHHLEQMAQAIYKSWFVDFEPFANGKFVDSELGEIPAGWSIQTIEYLAEKVAMGPFGSNIKVETFVESGVPIISGNHLRGLYLNELGYNFITEEHAGRLSNSLVRAGDIVFTHAGNIGQVALIPDDCNYPYYVISQRQFYLRCDKTKALPEYINYFFHSREGQGKLLANASQTGVPSIARPSSHLKNITVVLPPIEVQLEWFETVRAILQILNSNNKESKRLASIRDSLLPRLMSGELSVTDVDAK